MLLVKANHPKNIGGSWVDDYVEYFNEPQANYRNPSKLKCVAVSMNHWYRLRGHWISNSLHQHVAINW